MKATNASAARRHFLHRLAALALAGVGGCGTKEEEKTLPTNRLPSGLGKKPTEVRDKGGKT
jgi:hypothetical protein